MVSCPKLIDCAYFLPSTVTTEVCYVIYVIVSYVRLYDDDVLVGDDFDFIRLPRSIASLLLVALFKVDAIDAYIYCTH